MKICFNPLVMETFDRLRGVQSLLNTMNEGIPVLRERQNNDLEQTAAAEGWEYGQFAAERDDLNYQFHAWIPTFAAYSVTILLHSLVETQLYAFAEYMGKQRGSKLRVSDEPGRGVGQAVKYLQHVLSIDVTRDPDWSCLRDLQLLRNIIVHRGGKPGESVKHRKTVDDLVVKYEAHGLSLRRADGFLGIQEQIWIPMALCREFGQKIGDFLDRTFTANGLPNRHMQLHR